jgi:hypothetical protein
MGVRFSGSVNTTILVANLITTAEAIVATLTGLILPIDNAQVCIIAKVNLTVGASSTFAQLRIYRGNTLGVNQVGAAQNWPVTPAVVGEGGMTMAIDSPGAAGALTYSLSVAMIAATANSPVSFVEIAAFVF